MFEFSIENELISHSQSRFKPGDSCINHLLRTTHGIYQSLDDGFETRGIFLDISKTLIKFGTRVSSTSWSKMVYQVTFWMLSSIFVSKKRVVLNGQNLSWTNVEAGVFQGSIFGPSFFLIYINDLSDILTSNPKLFAYNTSLSLFSVIQNINLAANYLNNDLMKISDWAFQWEMRFDPESKKQAPEVTFSRKINKIGHPPLYLIKS